MRALAATLSLCWPLLGAAQGADLELRFSCSKIRDSGEQQVVYADIGEIRIVAGAIQAFRWESSLHRRTHGFDCSVDEEDGLQLQALQGMEQGWRISLRDAQQARVKRGFDTERGRQCSFRLLQNGDGIVSVIPSCAVLCGSRSNFSALRIRLADGNCEYEE